MEKEFLSLRNDCRNGLYNTSLTIACLQSCHCDDVQSPDGGQEVNNSYGRDRYGLYYTSSDAIIRRRQKIPTYVGVNCRSPVY